LQSFKIYEEKYFVVSVDQGLTGIIAIAMPLCNVDGAKDLIRMQITLLSFSEARCHLESVMIQAKRLTNIRTDSVSNVFDTLRTVWGCEKALHVLFREHTSIQMADADELCSRARERALFAKGF